MINSSILKKISKNVLNKNQIKQIKTNFTKITPNLNNINIIYNVTKNNTISSLSSPINKTFTINSFNNYKDRFYSTNVNQINNERNDNNKNNNENNNNNNNQNNNSNNNNNKNEKILNFLNRNKKNVLFSVAGIGLGFLSMFGNESSSSSNDDIEEEPYYFKILRFKITEKYLVVGSLIAANLLVFGLLKSEKFFTRFGNHFFLSPSLLSRHPLSLVLSTFTHTGGVHLLFNMYALVSFGSSAYDHLGTRDFLLLYFVGGLIGSMTSLTYKLLVGSYATPSIGASGSVLSMISSAIFFQDSRVSLIFFPFFDFPGTFALAAMVVFDFCGLLVPLFGRKTPLDHACHLGSVLAGSVVGLLYPYKEKYQHFNGTGKIVTSKFIYHGEIRNSKFNGSGELRNYSHIYRGLFKDDQFLKGQRYSKFTGITEYVENRNLIAKN
ncbi:hypothetical protein ACTA71_003440 [Dictyostelium dimigraforme]